MHRETLPDFLRISLRFSANLGNVCDTSYETTNDRISNRRNILQMIDHVIPGGGDIVLGQEYTDFDKGLEEGIEGSVLGFNLLLASAFDFLDSGYQRLSFPPVIAAATNLAERNLYAARIRTKIATDDSDRGSALDRLVSRRFALSPNWSRRISRSDRAKANESSAISSSPASPHLPNATDDTREAKAIPIRRNAIGFGADHAIGEIDALETSPDAPLGLQLMKLSYVRCQLGRGSPPIGGALMLISWSRTPVKVFGGATMKNVGNECGRF